MLSIVDIIEESLTLGGSDIHLLCGHPPSLRLYGNLIFLEKFPALTPEMMEKLFCEIAPERCQMELEEVLTTDFAYAYTTCRFRVAAFYQKGTIGINMRVLPSRFLTFEQIGLPDMMTDILQTPKGIMIVTGPTGSGKTTTLASMIQWINNNCQRHIITIEDPIEYYFEADKSIFTQREVKVDVPSFAEGTVRAMRMDPDIILIGEMRDPATIMAAVTAAETGHFVFSTLHTTGADRTVERVVGVFPTEQQEQVRIQLAGTLVGVVSQILLPKKGGGGRVPCLEIMICTNAIRHLIREKKEHSIISAIQTGQNLGMRTMDDALFAHYRRGLIDKEDVLRHAASRSEAVQRVGQIDKELMGGGGASTAMAR